ncbi:MAG: hypothetical protein IJK05_03780 [Bacteroidales bacterium]|nr:hypothetical protein [Bacteroidales bacterium]
MKNAFISIIISCLALSALSVNAEAQEFRVKKLSCVETEGILSSDAVYLLYRINDSETKRFPSATDMAFDEGTERADFCYLNVRKGDTIHIELWDHDILDPDDYLGGFDVKVGSPEERTVTIRQYKGTAVYRLTYVIE